jgi:hypothetical protein
MISLKTLVMRRVCMYVCSASIKSQASISKSLGPLMAAREVPKVVDANTPPRPLSGSRKKTKTFYFNFLRLVDTLQTSAVASFCKWVETSRRNVQFSPPSATPTPRTQSETSGGRRPGWPDEFAKSPKIWPNPFFWSKLIHPFYRGKK